MFNFPINKILIPTDFSKTSLKAIDHAVHMAKLTNAELVLLHASENLIADVDAGIMTFVKFQAEYEQEILNQNTKNLNEVAARIQKKGVKTVSTIIEKGKPYERIVAAAKKIKADLIIMGTHGVSGIREFFLGSNTFNVIRDAHCPVLSIQKSIKDPGFKNVLLPFRDKKHSRENVDEAVSIARLYGATLHVLGIDTEFTKTHKRKIELESKQIQELARKNGVKCNIKVIENAYLADVVLKVAKQKKADLIVIMSDLDRMDIVEYFTGPFAQQIVNHSPIPVLSIRPKINPKVIEPGFINI